MAIFGIGVDIISLLRVSEIYVKYGNKFAKRVLTKNEFEIFNSSSRKTVNMLAKKIAAKEALVKALGLGFGYIKYKDIEYFNDELGKPHYKISDKVNNFINSKTNQANFSIHLSISDEKDYAIASALIETN